jgi:prefoldin subunit 5
MYNHYFNDKVVTKGIDSDEFTDETVDSYMFRIINFLNDKTDLSKLKALRAIYRKLNLQNIDRLKSSTDALDLSIDIVATMLETISNQNGGQVPQGAGKGAGQGGNGNGDGEPADINEDGDGEIQSQPGDNDQMGGVDGVNIDAKGEDGADDKAGAATSGDAGDNRLSKNAAQQLAKKFQKQKDFLNGNIKKKSVSKDELSKLNDITESETELVRVGGDVGSSYGRISQGVDCIVVKKLTSNLLKSDDFPFSRVDWKTKEPEVWAEDEVKRGIVLGTMLGKKLQIRSESRETIFSRLKKGKIDKRMVAALGYDNDSVFYTNEIDQFNKANLHISLDYSGSMSGRKLKRTITSVVAIVKACEMARNLNVQVSVRSTDAGRNGGKSLPYICLIHDSRRDSFKQFAKYMSILDCSNTTPEGLCFEAIAKYLIPSGNSVDSYFLNFSDGQPAYSISTKTDSIHYSGNQAAEHTNRQVKKMIANGINVLSYFITDQSEDRFEHSQDWDTFKKSYGKGAKYVNVENMMQVAKTMNELFLSKPNRD